MKNREFRLARQGANCHVGLGHGSGESDKLYSSPKMGVTDVTVGVTVTSRLHRSYCCSRIPLLFCCYCSTLQHCSVPNVNQPYRVFTAAAGAGALSRSRTGGGGLMRMELGLIGVHRSRRGVRGVACAPVGRGSLLREASSRRPDTMDGSVVSPRLPPTRLRTWYSFAQPGAPTSRLIAHALRAYAVQRKADCTDLFARRTPLGGLIAGSCNGSSEPLIE